MLIFQVEMIHWLCHKTKEMDDTFLISNRRRFERALRRFDQENAQDPNLEASGPRLAAAQFENLDVVEALGLALRSQLHP